jgi:hypothetical protein
MTATIESLRAEVEYLRERLSELTGTVDQKTQLRHAFGLSPKQAGTLALLMGATRPISTTAIYLNVFERDCGDGPDLASVKVCLSQLRRRFADFKAPGGISNAYGTGCYTLAPELRAWVAERVSA